MPTPEQAYQLAVMLAAGMPGLEAIRYFVPEDVAEMPAQLKAEHDKWMKSPAVQQAQLAIMGKSWESRTLEEKIRFSVDKNYTERAYYLFSRNYAEITGNEKTKADNCLEVLERKLAGQAGSVDGLAAFYRDVQAKTSADKLKAQAKLAH